MRPLHTCLAANDLYAVAGILNGTTNFILEKMFCDQMSFADALALAQQLGYAERNPSAGADACRKICIISSLVLVSTFIRTVSLQRAFGIFSWKMSSWLSSWAVQ